MWGGKINKTEENNILFVYILSNIITTLTKNYIRTEML